MLEKPDLSDKNILTKLYDFWGIASAKLEFLPIGNDSSAWVYRVETASHDYFLKIRKGIPNQAVLHAPHYLHQHGINSPVALIPTEDDELCVPLDEFWLILHEWVHGTSAWDLTLSDQQWRSWGAIMRSIHDLPITELLSAIVPRETFDCKWNPTMERINHLTQEQSFDDPIQNQFVALWKAKQATIDHCHQRLQTIGEALKVQAFHFVLCHADIHKANIMIDQQDHIRIVDWDEVIVAPRERDLMFFVEDGHDSHRVSAFLEGYGDTDINPLAIAYYRYDWVVQEFSDYGERILLNGALSTSEKQFALDEFIDLFRDGDVIDAALASDANLKN